MVHEFFKMKKECVNMFVINLTEEVLEIGCALHEQVHGYIPNERYALAYALSSMSPGEILDILEEYDGIDE